MSGDQTNINMPQPRDALHEYRITKLEEAYERMSEALDRLVTEARMAKWVIGVGIAIVEPVMIALLIHYTTQ